MQLEAFRVPTTGADPGELGQRTVFAAKDEQIEPLFGSCFVTPPTCRESEFMARRTSVWPVTSTRAHPQETCQWDDDWENYRRPHSDQRAVASRSQRFSSEPRISWMNVGIRAISSSVSCTDPRNISLDLLKWA